MICANCKSNMVWQCDYDFSDYGIEDEQGIVSVYHCGECETLSENYIPIKGE